MRKYHQIIFINKKSILILIQLIQLILGQKSISLSLLKKVDTKNELQFDIDLINVDSNKALFEIKDDNKTTLNYMIDYVLIYTQSNDLNHLTTDTIKSTKQFQIQTNSISLLNKQDELIKSLSDIEQDANEQEDSGEKYNSEERILIKSKSYEDIHRFYINELESNRFYSINFTIKVSKAYLSKKILQKQDKIDKIELVKSFYFTFKTSFDPNLAALLACNSTLTNQIDTDLSQIQSSCYQPNSNCTQCKSTCYKLNEVFNIDLKSAIVCEPCPCDVSRSTGECIVLDRENKKNEKNKFQPDIVKCKMCIRPYTGLLCNECENDGIDYYKNELGECVKCDCNSNSYMDNNKNNNNENVGLMRRKCQAITGTCIDCMFNTTGKHCHECKPGYHGDAIRRTCIPYENENNLNEINNNKLTNHSKTINSNKNHLNEKYTSKTLALFTLYIFCILTLILLTFLCIKSKYSGKNMLKNDANIPNSLCTCLNNLMSSLNESTRNYRVRVSVFMSYLCPDTFNKLRSVNIQTNGSNSTSIYNRANNGLNDDDRLNLAEYQVFDDSLLVNDEHQNYIYRANFDNDDLTSTNNNPYRSLTIKS